MNRELTFWTRSHISGLVDQVEEAMHKLHRLVRTPQPITVHPYEDWLATDVPVQWLDDLLSSLRRHPHHQFHIVTRQPLPWQQRMNELADFDGRAAGFARLWLDGHIPCNLFLTQPDPTQPWLQRVLDTIPCPTTHPPTTNPAPTGT